MVKTHQISRKIQRSVANKLDRIRVGNFTEVDVKMLLVDLRELARYMQQQLKSQTNEFTAGLVDFLDVCDFIAHANRERGIVEEICRTYMQTLSDQVHLSQADFVNIPVGRVIDVEKIVMMIVVLAEKMQFVGEREKVVESVKELFERRFEIALCVMSLLQDSYITLQKNEGYGVLQLAVHEGKYRIYCRVFGNKIEAAVRELTGGTGSSVYGFPVMISSVDCADEEILKNVLTMDYPPVFETYRDEQMRLRIRQVE